MFKHLNGLAEECSRLTASFAAKVKGSAVQGTQYKKEKSKAEREREEFDDYLQWFTGEVKKNPAMKFDPAMRRMNTEVDIRG